MRIPKAPPVTIALMLTNLLLAGHLVHQFISPEWQSGMAPASVKSVELPGEPAEPHRLTGFTAMRDAPLFHSTRLPYVQPPEEVSIDPPAPPAYRLAGVIEAPGDVAIAVVSHLMEGTSRHLQVGDEADAWIVHAIRTGRVELRRGDSQIELTKPAPLAVTGLSIVARIRDEPTNGRQPSP